MTIEQLGLKNFTVFGDVVFDFCPGINVLIGANGTGKSHILKSLYCIQSAWDICLEQAGTLSSVDLLQQVGNEAERKLAGVFRISDRRVKKLIRDHDDARSMEVRVTATENAQPIRTKLEVNQEGVNFWTGVFPNTPVRTPAIFLPTREILALYEGFIAAYESRELAFDETFKDLCVHLSATPLRGNAASWGVDACRKLESVLGCSQASWPTVKISDGRFYVQGHEAHLVAEGHRKVAMILQLLLNGGIRSGCTIYWDEPESGLNPRLVKEIAELLVVLAECGLQIFIATHDYLLTSELSLAAEYQTSKTNFRFFCLHRPDAQSPVEVESGALITDLERNPILEEFAMMYDREAALFRQAETSVKGR